MEPIHNINVADVLRSHARSYPQKVATIYNSRRTSYPALDQRTTQLADALRGKGLGTGGRILWLGQNSDRLMELMLAAAKLGAVVCPANWRLSVAEMADVITDFAPHALFWQAEEIGETMTAAIDSSGYEGFKLQCDANGSDDPYEALLAAGSIRDDELPVDIDAPLMQIYTAAFAGAPQGALLSHRAILSQSLVLGMLQDLDSNQVFLNSGPLFHVGVWMTTWPTFLLGGTNVFVRRVDALELCEIIHAERCTGAYLVESTQEQMVQINHDRRYDLTCLRTHRGSDAWNAMVTPGTARWYQQFGGYGQTETMGLVTMAGFADPALGTHGRPSPVAAVRIFDDDGDELPPGEVGEIVVRGPTVMTGYHRRDGEPQSRTLRGWHRTNDLGRREADGSISFIGPKQRMIKSGVENIYPAELESCIRKLQGVADCAVIGVPHPKWIQSVKAIVVLQAPGIHNEQAIIDHCREHLASYKKPSQVVFVDSLPKKGFGNDYDALDEAFGGGNYPGGRTRSR